VVIIEGDNQFVVSSSSIPINIIHDEMEVEEALTITSATASANAVRTQDPSLEQLGNLQDLNNYLPDSGATQHMTPHLMDLQDVVEGQKLGVEVVDSHIIKCTTTGTVKDSHVR